MDAELSFRKDDILLDNILPEQSYVPFKAIKLATPELVWFNKELNEMIGMSEDNVLNTFAYVTPGYMPMSGLNEKDCQSFLADRYGSRYEACNGGSARCGIRNSWQVKGIGRNPLVAVNIDKDHSDGKLCLTKAISEAVWGEICHRELPYGAIRTLAIIKTGAWMDANYGLAESHMQPCALVIREVAIRPAHFERATFFWPDNAYMQLRNNDALRVQQAVEQITHFLPEGERGLVAGLTSFVEKMACQIAVSRVKGIPHGSLTSSNISIDGRFLDFGTLSAVPDFANYILAAGQGGIWDDHLLIAEWLRNIVIFINKYHPEKLDKNQLDTIITQFHNRLDLEENKAIAIQVGIKGSEKSLVSKGKKIKQILRENNKQPKVLHNFNNYYFFKKLSNALLPHAISARLSMFPLRDERFSVYTLTRAIADTVIKQGGGRESVSALIDSYINWKTLYV